MQLKSVHRDDKTKVLSLARKIVCVSVCMSVFKKCVRFDFSAKIIEEDTAKYCCQIIKMVMSDQETHSLLILTLSAMVAVVCTL